MEVSADLQPLGVRPKDPLASQPHLLQEEPKLTEAQGAGKAHSLVPQETE